MRLIKRIVLEHMIRLFFLILLSCLLSNPASALTIGDIHKDCKVYLESDYNLEYESLNLPKFRSDDFDKIASGYVCLTYIYTAIDNAEYACLSYQKLKSDRPNEPGVHRGYYVVIRQYASSASIEDRDEVVRAFIEYFDDNPQYADYGTYTLWLPELYPCEE